MRGKFVCLSVICHTSLALYVLHGCEPQPRRLSPWALGTCASSLPHLSPPATLRWRVLFFGRTDQWASRLSSVVTNTVRRCPL